MNPNLEQYLYRAEEQYLQSNELDDYRGYLAQFAEKVKVYEIIREQEIFLFKILADELQEQYPEERSQVLCEAISQWSLVLKYCCMAMILDNPEYLTARVDHWLRELISLRAEPQMDQLLYTTLVEILPEVLLDEQVALIQPFIEQVKELSGLTSESAQLLEIG